jgi:dephospho-CoA kinase
MPIRTSDRPDQSKRPVAGESSVNFQIRPHPLFIILRSVGVLAVILALAGAAWWLADAFNAPVVARGVLWAVIAGLGVLLAWNVLVWACRGYELTGTDGSAAGVRLVRTAGVLRRSRVEIPVARIQHIILYRSLRERLFGLGTLGFSTAGTAWVEMVWAMIDQPEERLSRIRAVMGEPRIKSDNRASPAGQSADPARVPVIGLAGGIGAGKSEVARILAEHGCYVIDSDKQAREALDRPEVRDQLVSWWGRGILGESGKIDRREVARIVFAHEQERTRLERLVHPLVRARREELIREARAAGAPAAVVDAPLLFEAGVDRECDAVIFIDTPRDVRLARLQKARGWTEVELDRRERAQLPLEEKSRRANFIIRNTGEREALALTVRDALEAILKGGDAPPRQPAGN